MPNHEHEHEHDHEHKQKPKPPNGPKERELAVALTVAALGAAKIAEPLEIVGKKTLELYAAMLTAVTKRAPGEHDVRSE